MGSHLCSSFKPACFGKSGGGDAAVVAASFDIIVKCIKFDPTAARRPSTVGVVNNVPSVPSADDVQLNKYKTDPYFLQNFQSDTTVCLI